MRVFPLYTHRLYKNMQFRQILCKWHTQFPVQITDSASENKSAPVELERLNPILYRSLVN